MPPTTTADSAARLLSSVDLDQTNDQQVSCAVIKSTQELDFCDHFLIKSYYHAVILLPFICGLHVFSEEEEASSL